MSRRARVRSCCSCTAFPSRWYSWRHQLPAIADAGYRVVAIDVRGYGRSSKPLAVEDYRMVRLVADNVGLVAALGIRDRRHRRSRLGRSDRVELGAAAARRVHRGGRPVGAVLPALGDASEHDDAGDGGRRGVLRRVLPGARPGRGRDRSRRARLAARVHVHRVGRRTATRPDATARWPPSAAAG